jgi:uncharacterized membrane protein YcaP (DUF421 family)
MNEKLIDIFGEGENLDLLQIVLRTIVVFFIGLLLIRISGRRSFGMRTPFDTILIVIFGSVLIRAIMGISPFLHTIVAAATIAVLHRVLGLIAYFSSKAGALIKGDVRVVYENGKFYEGNLKYCMVTVNDILEAVRLNLHEESFEKIESIIVERGGQISILKKN